MIGVILIFGPPLVVAATMLSPQGLAYTVNAVVGYAGIMLLLMPIAAWPLFLIQAVAPRPGQSRLRAIINTWLGGAVLSSAVMNLLASMLEYSPDPLHFNPTGHALIPYDPQTGFLLGAFAICMLVSTGCWGVLARVLPGGVTLRGAIMTGLLLFGAIASIGYVLSPQKPSATVLKATDGRLLEKVRPTAPR
jgi:hypothetical protein